MIIIVEAFKTFWNKNFEPQKEIRRPYKKWVYAVRKRIPSFDSHADLKDSKDSKGLFRSVLASL